jgi:hypothetical protein
MNRRVKRWVIDSMNKRENINSKPCSAVVSSGFRYAWHSDQTVQTAAALAHASLAAEAAEHRARSYDSEHLDSSLDSHGTVT